MRSARYKFGDKNESDKEACRKKRLEEEIKLRKNSLEEQMLKRRKICQGKYLFGGRNSLFEIWPFLTGATEKRILDF